MQSCFVLTVVFFEGGIVDAKGEGKETAINKYGRYIKAHQILFRFLNDSLGFKLIIQGRREASSLFQQGVGSGSGVVEAVVVSVVISFPLFPFSPGW